jgi:hypothetical protein
VPEGAIAAMPRCSIGSGDLLIEPLKAAGGGHRKH